MTQLTSQTKTFTHSHIHNCTCNEFETQLRLGRRTPGDCTCGGGGAKRRERKRKDAARARTEHTQRETTPSKRTDTHPERHAPTPHTHEQTDPPTTRPLRSHNARYSTAHRPSQTNTPNKRTLKIYCPLAHRVGRDPSLAPLPCLNAEANHSTSHAGGPLFSAKPQIPKQDNQAAVAASLTGCGVDQV